MLVYNANNESGQWEFDLQLTNQEVDYLVNLAVGQLLTAGMISVTSQLEEQKVTLPAIKPEEVN